MPKRLSARSPSITSQESSYSAVIIADMVAEVEEHCEADHRSSSETNLHEKKSNLVADNVELNSSDAVTNGTNISKGVILNANDIKLGKPVGTQKTKEEKQSSSFKDDFKQMSSLRKVAFGFSFLPSIMFVLCFAVIFPCEKVLPCVKVQWSIHLNDTEITSNLLVPVNVLFTFSNEEGSGVRSLSQSSGDILWENNLTSSSKFFECGKFAYADKQSCLIMDSNGTMHLFDPSNGRNLWELKLNTDVFSITVLPDCNKDGLDEIAVATSNSQIKIISIRNILIKGCDPIPLNLMTWKKQNETDLVFVCRKGTNEILMKVSQEEWCKTGKNQEVKMSTLTTKKAGILSQSKFLSMNEGLVVWTHDSVTMFKNDGQQKWSIPSSNRSTKNRFLISGKYRSDKKEIFLYSSDMSSNLQVTRINAENGNIMKTKSFPHLELTEVVMIRGQEYDFLLGLKKKFSESLKSKAVSHITEVSTSVINILSNEEMASVSSNTSSKIIQEITLMEMDGNDLKTIQSEELNYVKGESYASSFTVDLKDNLMQLFVIRKSLNSFLDNSTVIKSISVSNWDTSSEKTSHCVWKQ